METERANPLFGCITADELRVIEFPPEQWLVNNVIYSEGFCFIYGAEGTGKSFITLSLAQAVATGTDWLGQFKVPHAVKVMFIDKENPMSMLARRIKGMSVTGVNISWVRCPEGLQLTDEKGNITPFAQALADKVEVEEIGLIVIDSFIDLITGNENVAGDTQVFFDTIRKLFPQKAILVLHHENKPASGVFRSDAQRTRGSSNINAQTVTQFRLEAVAKSKTELTLKQTKARDAQKLDKFMIRMVVEPEGEGTKVTGFEYVGVVTDTGDTNKSEEVEALITEMLIDSTTIRRTEIIETGKSQGISERTIGRTIKRMVENGQITADKIGHYQFYSWTDSVKTKEEDE